MRAALGTYDGEGTMVERQVKRRRLTDAEVLASRDIWIAEMVEREWTQDRIARTLNLTQQAVSHRLHQIDGEVRDAIERAAKTYPGGIPGSVLDRLREALMESRREQRRRRREPEPWEHRTLA